MKNQRLAAIAICAWLLGVSAIIRAQSIYQAPILDRIAVRIIAPRNDHDLKLIDTLKKREQTDRAGLCSINTSLLTRGSRFRVELPGMAPIDFTTYRRESNSSFEEFSARSQAGAIINGIYVVNPSSITARVSIRGAIIDIEKVAGGVCTIVEHAPSPPLIERPHEDVRPSEELLRTLREREDRCLRSSSY